MISLSWDILHYPEDKLEKLREYTRSEFLKLAGDNQVWKYENPTNPDYDVFVIDFGFRVKDTGQFAFAGWWVETPIGQDFFPELLQEFEDFDGPFTVSIGHTTDEEGPYYQYLGTMKEYSHD